MMEALDPGMPGPLPPGLCAAVVPSQVGLVLVIDLGPWSNNSVWTPFLEMRLLSLTVWEVSGCQCSPPCFTL